MEYRLDLNNLYKILELVSDYNCKLLPVIKGRNEEDILQLYNEGFREFGENRLNELSDHARFLPEARFHFIAPLQSRKIREIMNSCDFIHTLQRPKEILAINECYENQDIFVQINIEDDPNKSGININEVDEFFDNFEGLREFGENRLNELSDHARFLPEARFHFIAPLQSRKIGEIMTVSYTHLTLPTKRIV